MNVLANLISQIQAIDWSLNARNFVEIFVIVAFLTFSYFQFIKNTNTEKFVKGLFALVFLWVSSEVLVKLGWVILGVFLKGIVTLVSLSLIVVFQPELRKFLGSLGQVDLFEKLFSSKGSSGKDEKIDVIKEIIETVKFLTKSHTGALIVFQGDLAHTYSDVGTQLNADLSTELLLTIFHHNTPLHDGAVIVSGTKILSAGVLLPLTEDPKLSWKYGTRHRAAIGMSEVSDAACLVVSEETGDVSMALDGSLKKYEDLVTLKADLENLLGCKSCNVEEKKSIIGNFISVNKDDNITDKV